MANCSSCGDPKAELGFHRFYCPNPDCQNFDKKTLNRVVTKLEQEAEKRQQWLQLSLDDVLGEYYD